MAIAFLFLVFLSGCNTSAIYWDHLYNPPVYWGNHVVKKGETLYGIAWRYGRDFRELGDANGLEPPWTIHPGDVLRLDKKGSVSRTASASSRSSGSAPRRTASSSPAARTSEPKRTTSGSPVASDIDWRWPHGGTVIAGFSASGKVNKGVDIAGKSGDDVKAAASGSVVYAGSGLLGYGNLIIVNHSEHYLSAYAHNRKILVQEGEDVEAGQVIAELGSTGTDKPMLHFEIRRNGNPVDPTRYLPRR
ncbi:MAG: peptidoglycan DD-metalloendopeptidase family protein [Marinobacter sp.]|nr:peptidoglycan DD-metalloendopeptidase family protein [Marinobacter sp.]